MINYQDRASTNQIAGEMPISEILKLIKEGSPETDLLIEKARKAGKGTIEYDNIKKKQLPAFLFNFRFEKELANKNIISSTGLLYLDIDGINSATEFTAVKTRIKQLPFVFACWKSLSEKGLSIIVSVEEMNAENYIHFKTYFLTKYNYNNETKEGFNWDINTWKQTQKTILSRDEDIYINDNCICLGYNVVNQFCFSNSLIKEVDEVQISHLLNPEKNSQGNRIAPLENKTNTELNGIDKTRFSDRYKYAEPGKPYTVYPNGVWINEMYFPKKYIIKEGKRRTLLYYYACKAIRINGEDFSKVYSFLKWLRDARCENPKTFSNAELKDIVWAALKGYNNAKIPMKRCVVIFPEYSTLTAKEKRAISSKEVGKIKSDKTIRNLEGLYKEGMRQFELIAAAKNILSERTVKDYWNEDEKGRIYFVRPIRTVKRSKNKNNNREG